MTIEQDEQASRQLGNVTAFGWILIAALLFVRLWRLWGIADGSTTFGFAVLSFLLGSLLAVVFVAAPYRVWQNLTQPERRRARIGETLVCIVTFLAVVNAFYWMVTTYPRDW